VKPRTCRWAKTWKGTCSGKCCHTRRGAWIDHEKTKVGYAIPFRQHFHVHPLMRDLAVIDAELKELADRIAKQIAELPR
jgi:hypothetical protein